MSVRIVKLLRFFKSDEAELRQADTSEVSETAVELLEQQEREEFVNADFLVSAGRKFRVTEHHSIDAAVEMWLLLKKQTCRRFDVASLFLAGYWGAKWPIQETLAKCIVDELPRCELDRDALQSMLVALCQVSQAAVSDETKRVVRGALLTYASKSQELKLEPGTINLIHEAVRQTT
jgi:hypothetical protein